MSRVTTTTIGALAFTAHAPLAADDTATEVFTCYRSLFLRKQMFLLLERYSKFM